jgi:hypothetical protein
MGAWAEYDDEDGDDGWDDRRDDEQSGLQNELKMTPKDTSLQ